METCIAVAETLTTVVSVCHKIIKLTREVKSQPARCQDLLKRVESVQPTADLIRSIVAEHAEVANVCKIPLEDLLEVLNGMSQSTTCMYVIIGDV